MNTARHRPIGIGRSWMVLWLILLAVCLPALAAGALIPVPPLQARLTDLTRTLTPEQQNTLEQSLRAFEARKGTQIAVLMVSTTMPEEIEQYTLRVVEQWKLGRKKVDDGALLLIAKDDRALRIEVGYGLEGALNDATAKRIISEVITPRFKEGDYFAGVSAGVDQMIRVADGEPLPAPKPGAGGGFGLNNIGQLIPVLFVAAMVVGGMLRSLLGRVPGALATGGILGLAGWFFGGAVITAAIGGIAAFLITLIGLNSGRRGGFYGGMGGGGRSGGGGFSGGFGGGGGGFGGGGASGRW